METMPAVQPEKESWFQFSLSTAIGWMVAAAALMFINTAWGWPMPSRGSGYVHCCSLIFDICFFYPGEYGNNDLNLFAVAWNMLANLLLFSGILGGMNWWRHRSEARGHRHLLAPCILIYALM